MACDIVYFCFLLGQSFIIIVTIVTIVAIIVTIVVTMVTTVVIIVLTIIMMMMILLLERISMRHMLNCAERTAQNTTHIKHVH